MVFFKVYLKWFVMCIWNLLGDSFEKLLFGLGIEFCLISLMDIGKKVFFILVIVIILLFVLV